MTLFRRVAPSSSLTLSAALCSAACR
jgi:hypothetical protein